MTGGGVAVTVVGAAGVAVIVTGGTVVADDEKLLMVATVVAGLADPAVRFPHPAKTASAMAPADNATADRGVMFPPLGEVAVSVGRHRRILRLGQSPELETDLVVVNGLTVSLDVRIAAQSALPASRIHGIPHLVVRRVTMRG
jgi:hypothetical protein